ncbi:hypothetical protein BDW60DRAFT_207905 [Aspergillus nidulans var. acristatus]
MQLVALKDEFRHRLDLQEICISNCPGTTVVKYDLVVRPGAGHVNLTVVVIVAIALVAAFGALAYAAIYMEEQYNKHHQPMHFEKGKEVLLQLYNGYNIPANKRLSQKPGQQFAGPFKVLQRASKVTYMLDFPLKLKIRPSCSSNLSWRILTDDYEVGQDVTTQQSIADIDAALEELATLQADARAEPTADETLGPNGDTNGNESAPKSRPRNRRRYCSQFEGSAKATGVDAANPVMEIADGQETVLKPWQVKEGGSFWMLSQEAGPALTLIARSATRLGPDDQPYRPTLILCPAGLMDTWFAEIATRFGSLLPVRIFHRDREHTSDELEAAEELVGNYDKHHPL